VNKHNAKNEKPEVNAKCEKRSGKCEVKKRGSERKAKNAEVSEKCEKRSDKCEVNQSKKYM
jgi:hypothetical protein